MSRLRFNSKQQAQQRADQIHEALKQDSPIYRASCDAGQTLRWAIPEDDEHGKARIVVDSRCEQHLTEAERQEQHGSEA